MSDKTIREVANSDTIIEKTSFATEVEEPVSNSYEKNFQNNEESATMREDDYATRVEQPGDSRKSTNAQQPFILPDDVARDYDWVENLPYSSGESKIMVIRHRDTGVLRFFKLYNENNKPNSDVLEQLQRNSNKNHVVDIIDFRSENVDRAWEIQEYCELGSLDAGPWAKLNRNHLDEDSITEILKEISEAIHFLHHLQEGVAHRDIKPSNILIRSASPFDLVLTDFGIARDYQEDTHKTSFAGTNFYAAPEAHKGESSMKSDWFALGAIIYQLLSNKMLLERPGDKTAHEAIANCLEGKYYKNVILDNIPNERWLNLVRGLVTKQRQFRWGYKEVSKWLKGKNPKVVWIEADGGDAGISPDHCYQPPWEDDLIATPSQLAYSLGNNWNEAKKGLMGRERSEIIDFLNNFHHSHEPIALLESKKPLDVKLLELQLMLDTKNDPFYDGCRLTSNNIKDKIESASNNDNQAKTWLFDLVKCNGLVIYGEYRNDKKSSVAGRRLAEWLKQSNQVKSLVPNNRKRIADIAFREHLAELFVKAFE